MKLTFTTSLLLLTTATASSSSGGGLRSRRLSLFAEDAVSSSKANKNSDSDATAEDPVVSASKSDKGGDDDAGDSSGGNGGKSGKDNKDNDSEVGAKAAKSGNVLGGAKAAKAESQYIKKEAPRPFSGIETSEDLYYFGEDISATFYLNEDYITEASMEYFNATLVEDYQIAMYAYMGRPNCEGNDPIASAAVSIADGGTADPIEYEGTFTLSTSVDFRELGGTGYDLFLLDETGCNIILGPEAVTITLTPEAQEAEDNEAKAKSEKARTPQAKAEKIKTAKKKSYKVKKEKVDQSKVELAGKVGLSTDDYTLETDKNEYELDEAIEITYSISAPPAATAEGRRLKKKKKKKDTAGMTEDEVVALENAETEDADDAEAETADAVAPAEAEEPEEEYDPNFDPSLAQPDPEVSEEDGQEESGEGSPQPDELPDVALEEETEIDPTDITLYTVGVFMKMANPQGGRLLPLFSTPLCGAESCSVEEISSGTITISSSEIDTTQYGTGFDLWILDGTGDGIAGPHYFTIGEE